MDKLFDTADVITCTTAEKAVLKMTGYFGDTLSNLITAIEEHKIKTLTDIDQSKAYCFGTNDNRQYILFLPANKVKSKKPIYRSFSSLDELFDFFFPDFNKDTVYDSNGNKIEVDTNKKAEYLLGKKAILKYKDGSIKAIVIHDIDFNGTGSDVIVNSLSLIYLFNNFEIKQNGEFVPFGIKEE